MRKWSLHRKLTPYELSIYRFPLVTNGTFPTVCILAEAPKVKTISNKHCPPSSCNTGVGWEPMPSLALPAPSLNLSVPVYRWGSDWCGRSPSSLLGRGGAELSPMTSVDWLCPGLYFKGWGQLPSQTGVSGERQDPRDPHMHVLHS